LAQRIADSFPKIDNDIVTELFHTNDEYAAFRSKANEIQRANSFIMEVLEGDKEVSLSVGEHKALVEYLSLTAQMENMGVSKSISVDIRIVLST